MAKLISRLTFGENLDEKFVKIPYLVLVVSIILSIGVTFLFYRSTLSKDQIRFNNSTNQVQITVENKINSYISLLKSARAYIESTENLNSKKFKLYAESLELEKNYVGLIGIAYSKIVKPNERENLINAMKSEGFTDFKIFPEGERELYNAIIYIEPLDEQNKKALGFDMATEENRREALNRARDFATEAATAKVILIQSNNDQNQPGFLIYLPVFKDGKEPSTIQERREKLIGYIYCPFLAKDFLSATISEKSFPDIEFKIYDNELKPENLLTQTKNAVDDKKDENFYVASNLEVAGRRWIIEYKPTHLFYEQSNQDLLPLIFIGGMVFSFLLFWITYVEAVSRQKLQKVAFDLLEVEEQKQTLLEKEQRARLSAEQANKTKDEFISVVSHELRTPLNAIAGWAKILKSDNLSGNTKELALQKIDKNLRSQTKIVEEILDFSQMISGKVNLETEQFVFSDVFENVLCEIEPKAQEKSLKLIKSNTLDGQIVCGDRRKIQIVIENLLSNAIKFTPAGGEIEAEVKAEDNRICLTVKDNGNGINSDFLPHIFDRFRQNDASSTRFQGGLGLGLAITEHIVKLHQGTIEAQSEGKEKGSTFIVTIPFKPQ